MTQASKASSPLSASEFAAESIEKLGPFAPPADYPFEPELRSPTPRTIPDEVREGPHARRWRSSMISLLIVGVAFIALGLLPIVRFMGLFFLPLYYLSWIGVLLLIIGMARLGLRFVRRGPYAYIEDGVPVVARICSLVLQPTSLQNGQPTTYAFAAVAQYRDPASGEVVSSSLCSRDFSAMQKLRFTTSYRVGDYVTAIYLRRDPQKTMQLYGFLDLKPNLGVIDRDASSAKGALHYAVFALIILAIFAALIWDMYAIERYTPVTMEIWQGIIPFVVGAITLGGLMLYVVWRDEKNRREKIAVRNSLAMALGEPVELEIGGKRNALGGSGILVTCLIIAGSCLIGGFTMLCWFFTANAVFDRSPARLELVQISDMIQETHKGIVNIYKIKYRRQGDPKEYSILSTPDEMDRFVNNLAMADLRSGWLGLPWVNSLTPIVPVKQPVPANP